MYRNPSQSFTSALKKIDRNAAMRLAKQAIAADPDKFDYQNAHHEAFAIAFILAHEGRPITAEEVDKLSWELAGAGEDDINDPYADMYNTAWHHGGKVF